MKSTVFVIGFFFLTICVASGNPPELPPRRSVSQIIQDFERVRELSRSSQDLYPSKDLFSEYSFERIDRKHRIGFTVDPLKPCLYRKWQEFKEKEAANSEIFWIFRASFWKWLDEEANGDEIPRVIYLKPGERSKYQVTFRGNSISSGALDELRQSQSGGLLEVMFVMDRRGGFYVAPKDRGSVKRSAFQHSSFFSGQPVSGAGLFIVDLESGEIQKYNRLSGHYRFGINEISPTFEALKRAGVDLKSVEFDLNSLEHSDLDSLRETIPTKVGKQAISISEWQDIYQRSLILSGSSASP